VKFRLKKLEKFSGEKATFYSIIADDQDLFARFIDENIKIFSEELIQIAARIKTMGTKHGAIDIFFKLEESSEFRDEKVVAFHDIPESKLRLYCVKISDSIVILGGGGHKAKSIVRWQENLKLKKEAHLVMAVSELIELKLQQRKLSISGNNLAFIGDLKLN
jgi:hypothetical protein